MLYILCLNVPSPFRSLTHYRAHSQMLFADDTCLGAVFPKLCAWKANPELATSW